MIIFFYILREYFKYVAGALTLSIFIFVLFDFIHKSTKYFVKFQPSSTEILYFYFYQIPSQVVQALPIAALLASVIAMVLLSRSNEVTAMRAAGMSPIAIAAPLGAGGLILSMISFALGEVAVPAAAKKMYFIQEVLIEGKEPEQLSEHVHWIRDGDKFYHFERYDSLEQRLSTLKVLETGKNFRISKSTHADSATFRPDSKDWKLAGISITYFSEQGTVEHQESLDNLIAAIPIDPQKLRKERRKPNELSIRELGELIDRGERLGMDTLAYKVDYHIKFAYPLAAFVVSLIGLNFGYRSERTTETVKSILLAFTIGTSYWFLLSAGRALGRRGDIEPLFAAWLANFVLFSIALGMIIRTRRA